jgi:hypothetical protein
MSLPSHATTQTPDFHDSFQTLTLKSQRVSPTESANIDEEEYNYRNDDSSHFIIPSKLSVWIGGMLFEHDGQISILPPI